MTQCFPNEIARNDEPNDEVVSILMKGKKKMNAKQFGSSHDVAQVQTPQ